MHASNRSTGVNIRHIVRNRRTNDRGSRRLALDVLNSNVDSDWESGHFRSPPRTLEVTDLRESPQGSIESRHDSTGGANLEQGEYDGSSG